MGLNLNFNPLEIVDRVTGHSRREERRQYQRSVAREDQLRGQDRRRYLSDRRNQRRYDSRTLRRLVYDAEKAGLHPLAALGAQVAGPATSFQSQAYPDYGGGSSYDSGGVSASLSLGEDDLSKAQERLVNKQADLIDEQIKDSQIARMRQAMSNDQLGAPSEITPQTVTPVIERDNTDPSVADAETKTRRYGESEMYETLLWLRTYLADWMYRKTGVTEYERSKGFNDRIKRLNRWLDPDQEN